MSFYLQKSGWNLFPEAPRICYRGYIDDMVDLNVWISFVARGRNIHESKHLDSRPTAVFRSKSSNEIELVYVFGYIIPEQSTDFDKHSIMLELIEDLNRFVDEIAPDINRTP